jgi:hypothetical protein
MESGTFEIAAATPFPRVFFFWGGGDVAVLPHDFFLLAGAIPPFPLFLSRGSALMSA